MKRQTFIDLLLLVLIAAFSALIATAPQARAPAADVGLRFEAVDVFMDSGAKRLAAYEFELSVERGSAEIVGLEGGEKKAFAEAPYYDPAALRGKRIIVAAYSLDANLPTGRTRVARLHMQISGPGKPLYAVKLIEACGPGGEKIAATASAE